jgi:hypothetical protein
MNVILVFLGMALDAAVIANVCRVLNIQEGTCRDRGQSWLDDCDRLCRWIGRGRAISLASNPACQQAGKEDYHKAWISTLSKLPGFLFHTVHVNIIGDCPGRLNLCRHAPGANAVYNSIISSVTTR